MSIPNSVTPHNGGHYFHPSTSIPSYASIGSSSEMGTPPTSSAYTMHPLHNTMQPDPKQHMSSQISMSNSMIAMNGQQVYMSGSMVSQLQQSRMTGMTTSNNAVWSQIHPAPPYPRATGNSGILAAQMCGGPYTQQMIMQRHMNTQVRLLIDQQATKMIFHAY